TALRVNNNMHVFFAMPIPLHTNPTRQRGSHPLAPQAPPPPSFPSLPQSLARPKIAGAKFATFRKISYVWDPHRFTHRSTAWATRHFRTASRRAGLPVTPTAYRILPTAYRSYFPKFPAVSRRKRGRLENMENIHAFFPRKT